MVEQPLDLIEQLTDQDLGNSELLPPAQPPEAVQLAFSFDLQPQAPDRRLSFANRLKTEGLTCYWEIYERLLYHPPEWETKFWTDHPNRKREWPRKALYMAWACAPDTARQPRTLEEFAAQLGISRVAIWHWRTKNPEMVETINDLALAPLEAAVKNVDYVTIFKAQQMDRTVADANLFYSRREQARRERQPAADPLTSQLVQVIFNNLDISKLSEDKLERLASGENPIAVLIDPGQSAA